jgi:penicillin-binding protein 1C
MCSVRISRRHVVCLALLAALAGFTICTVVYATLLADLPPVSEVEQRVVRPTTRILDRNGRLLYEVLDPNAGKQFNLSIDEIPTVCVQATLATEDSRFYQHPGVDPLAIGRAVWQNARAGGTVVSGGSTITQQVARNLLLGADERYTQSYQRKVREAWLALLLELRYTKSEVLALYFNQTYYGNFAFGLEAAAQIFFAKPARQLSRGECALLAGLVQYPTGYNPLQEPEVAKARQLTVLRLMEHAGFVDALERQEIAQEPLRYKTHLFDIAAPHFVMYVQDLLVQRLGSDRLRDGGLTVATTLDIDLQREAEAAVRHRLDLLNCRRPGVCDANTNPNRRVDNAAVVVLDSHNGEILAMVGSPDYFDESIQGNVNAALSQRQPGSAIKPLTYAVALDPQRNRHLGLEPLTPASIIADLPTTFYVTDQSGANVPYSPVNYDRQVHGPVSVRTALANSYNIPAVKTLERIGVDALKQVAADAGISTFTGDFGLALTLGGGEVKLLELTAAFGILDDGRRLDTSAITQIEGADISFEDRPAAQQSATDGSERSVIQPETAFLLTDILSDDLARLPAFGEDSVINLPFAAAVKTGTTTDWRDNWTIGYTTERIVGVWVGNADNAPMLDVSGVDGAGPIWRDIMLAAHRTPPAEFTQPETIVEVLICAPSGLLPTPACPRTRLERFIRGSEPTQPDDQFLEIAIDRANGRRADVDTPPNRLMQRVYWSLPAEYHDWMVSNGVALAPPTEEAEMLEIGDNPASGQFPIASRQSLILTAPTSNTSFQIHPGMPRASQRIEIAGYSADGQPWAELRLMHNGQMLHQSERSDRVRDWWMLQPGENRFWLEGRRTADDPVERSSEALVVVQEFVADNDVGD